MRGLELEPKDCKLSWEPEPKPKNVELLTEIEIKLILFANIESVSILS